MNSRVDGKNVILEEFRDNGVFVQDASDYMASMYTQANFGCVKFKQAS